jgi:hypothetical protein
VDLGKLRGRRGGSKPTGATDPWDADPPAPPPARTGGHGGGKWTLTDDGRDATLHFGKHNGQQISAMALDSEARGYLKWMLGADFPADLLAVVRRHLGT